MKAKISSYQNNEGDMLPCLVIAAETAGDEILLKSFLEDIDDKRKIDRFSTNKARISLTEESY